MWGSGWGLWLSESQCKPLEGLPALWLAPLVRIASLALSPMTDGSASLAVSTTAGGSASCRQCEHEGLAPRVASPPGVCSDFRQAKAPSPSPTCTRTRFPYCIATRKRVAITRGVRAGGLGLAKVRASPWRASPPCG